MPIKAITFDFWSTLFRDANGAPRQQIRIDALAEATAASVENAAAALDLVWPEFARSHREDRRTLTPYDAVRMACRHLNAVVEEPAFSKLADVFATAILVHSPEPIEGALDAVRAASEVLPIALISDTGVSPGSSLRQLLDRYGFTPFFHSMIFSDEVGVSKPQAPMYEAAARDLGVKPRELLHIGDLEYTDILGAKSIGAAAWRFVGDNPGSDGESQADRTFAQWREFIEALPEIIR